MSRNVLSFGQRLLISWTQECDMHNWRDNTADRALPHKPEDQGSDPQNPHECWAGMAATCDQSTWESETVIPQGKLALGELWFT